MSNKKYGNYELPKDFDVSKPFYIVDRNKDVKFVHLADVIDVDKHIWKTSSGATIISLVGLQQIALIEEIVEKKFESIVNPSTANWQQHIVNLWLGFKGDGETDNWARGSGEASSLNTGKVIVKGGERKIDERGNIDSSYKYAMADKRAFCRAMQKLIHLHGIYANVESSEFAKENFNDDEGVDL